MNIPNPVNIKAVLKKLAPDATIPPGALHSLDGKTFHPIFNLETVGQKVKDFNRDFYILVQATIEE